MAERRGYVWLFGLSGYRKMPAFFLHRLQSFEGCTRIRKNAIENLASPGDYEPVNMKVLDLKKMRDRAPFRAFKLHLTNGETLPVRHPEYLAVPPESGTELLVVWVGADWNLVDAGQVARVSLLNSKAVRSKS